MRFRSEHWPAWDARRLVPGWQAFQINIYFGFQRDGEGHFFLRSLVAGRIHSDGVIAQAVQDEEDSSLSGRSLVGGLFANGRMSTATKIGLVVPQSAVDVRGSIPFVIRVKQGKAEKVPVKIGLTDKTSETIEVLSGLQPGDTLLLGAALGITPGTLVRISAPTGSPAANSGRGS